MHREIIEGSCIVCAAPVLATEQYTKSELGEWWWWYRTVLLLVVLLLDVSHTATGGMNGAFATVPLGANSATGCQ